jgi:hypothetical protein
MMKSRLIYPFALAALVVGCDQPADLNKVASREASLKIRTALAGPADAAGEAAESTSTGWATLKGRLTYAGDPPQMPPYAVNKDQATCAPGGKAPPQEKLVVDSATKGIANVAIYVRKASRVHESAEPKTEPVVFDQKVCVFLTHVTALTVGQALDIRNSDDVGHNTSIAGQNTFNQIISSGGSTEFVVKKEEATPQAVRCSIHPWMLAYLLPRKNGYFAVTKPDGSFEIPNLPAGEEVEIQVWHESASGPQQSLVVDTPEAKELKWDGKGRFKVKLEPDETREVELAIPPAAFAL